MLKNEEHVFSRKDVAAFIRMAAKLIKNQDGCTVRVTHDELGPVEVQIIFERLGG